MEIGVKYTMEFDEMWVSSEGQNLLVKYLLDRNLPISGLISSRWDWGWIKQSGKYRGKLPKRVARMMKFRYDVVLTPEQMSEIGNIAREHILSRISYTLDFDDGLDWSAGDFGDVCSCFWTRHTPARNELRKNDVLAIRLYDEEAKGYARAWVYKMGDDTWVLFNAYGVTTQVMANIFAKFLIMETDKSWEYTSIYLTVNGDSSDLMYINAHPQVVYVKGTSPPDYIDLEWDLGDYVMCCNCEAYVELGTESHYRGSNYCDSCLEEVAVRCSICEDIIFDKDDERMHDGRTLCSCCYDTRL